MRSFKGILLFCAFTMMFSCEVTPFINCSECIEKEPLDTDITIRLSEIGYENIIVNVYEGELEDNVLLRTLTIKSVGETTVRVPVNKNYTLTATYKYENDTYTAVDSAFPKVKYEEQECENPCYYVYNNKVNLRLKYL